MTTTTPPNHETNYVVVNLIYPQINIKLQLNNNKAIKDNIQDNIKDTSRTHHGQLQAKYQGQL